MLFLKFFLFTISVLVACSGQGQKRRWNSSSSDSSLFPPISDHERTSTSSSDHWYWLEDGGQCLGITLNILAPYRGVIKQVAIKPGMGVDKGQILYVLLNASAQGNVQKPLRTELPGVITTVLVNKLETIVEKGQVLATIEVLVCNLQQQQQGNGQTQQNRKNRGNRIRRRGTSESLQGLSEQESELEAWRAYRWRYPHQRYG